MVANFSEEEAMAQTKLIIGATKRRSPTLFELSIWLSVLFERHWRTADELAAAET